MTDFNTFKFEAKIEVLTPANGIADAVDVPVMTLTFSLRVPEYVNLSDVEHYHDFLVAAIQNKLFRTANIDGYQVVSIKEVNNVE